MRQPTGQMPATDDATQWELVYAEKGPREVSWYEPVLEDSLALIGEAELDRGAAILDVGGFPAFSNRTVRGHHIARVYQYLAALDLSDERRLRDQVARVGVYERITRGCI